MRWVKRLVVATQIFFIFTPIPGEMIQFDEHIFQMGWNHQLEEVGGKVTTTHVVNVEFYQLCLLLFNLMSLMIQLRSLFFFLDPLVKSQILKGDENA